MMVGDGLDAMAVEAKKLNAIDLTFGDPVEERDAIHRIALSSTSSIDMIEFQNPSVIDATGRALASESIDGSVTSRTPSSALAFSGQFTSALGVASAPFINFWLATKVFAVRTHTALRKLRFDTAIDAHDFFSSHIENHSRGRRVPMDL